MPHKQSPMHLCVYIYIHTYIEEDIVDTSI